MPRTAKQDANLKPGTPLKPGNLSARAAREWDRLTSELEGAQIQVSTAHRALLSLAATIAADGKFYGSMKDGKASFVDLRDIAAVAVTALTSPGP